LAKGGIILCRDTIDFRRERDWRVNDERVFTKRM